MQYKRKWRLYCGRIAGSGTHDPGTALEVFVDVTINRQADADMLNTWSTWGNHVAAIICVYTGICEPPMDASFQLLITPGVKYATPIHTLSSDGAGPTTCRNKYADLVGPFPSRTGPEVVPTPADDARVPLEVGAGPGIFASGFSGPS